MARKKRKIGFYYLTCDESFNVIDEYKRVINHIIGLEKTNKTYNLGDNKFCLLDTAVYFREDTRSNLVIKSAKHSFRPNLIHRETVNERESPKQLAEGEIQKTHLVTKFENGEILFVMEKHINGVNISQFVKYLNSFSIQIEAASFSYEVLAKDNFLDEIDLLTRVTCADVYVDKQLLGSDALNYSERIHQVKHEIILTVKATKSHSIVDFARDTFAKMNGGDTSIRKIRLVGRNLENNEVVINTDFIEKQEFIMPEKDDITGELSSTEVFIEMNAVLENSI